MNKIKVTILQHSFNHMPIFLAQLTQRGHIINNYEDLISLYNKCCNKIPSEQLLKLPHNTISRMCTMTVAIYGLSTKAANQLRTHAKHGTFITTSSQYSDFSTQDFPYVIPNELDSKAIDSYKEALQNIHKEYSDLTKKLDKDIASYLLPQSLRKCMIIHASFPEWQHILSTRLCNRNSKETQYVAELILKEMSTIKGSWAKLCLPSCVYDKCHEGKFSCGHKYKSTIDFNI